LQADTSHRYATPKQADVLGRVARRQNGAPSIRPAACYPGSSSCSPCTSAGGMERGHRVGADARRCRMAAAGGKGL